MRWLAAVAALAMACVGGIAAQADEVGAAAVFDRVVAQPARLRVFLQAMPKGGDLHNHLGGNIYAEQFLAWGGEAGLCVSRQNLAFADPPCTGPDLEPARDLGRRDQALYDALINSFSTRGRNQGLGVNDVTGHDDFFDTFDRFIPASRNISGKMVALARTSAAANGVTYLELMENPMEVNKAGMLAQSKPWEPADFDAAYARIAPALPGLLDAAVADTDAREQTARRELGCDAAPASPACAVTVRYQAYALRLLPAPIVFGQLAAAFALVDRDPRYVGVNIVAPEDGAVAVADFDLHMRMVRYFAARYPKVKLSLHAGELDLGLVPPSVLGKHIRASIEVAGARRIGHGVDIPYDADAPGLLARMARERIAVEINLTSNDTILGVRGARHPLALYRAAGVPVVLSTDDEGVSRSDMTNEYLRAATEQGLRYGELKDIARASLEYAFLPGASLWQDGRIGTRIAVCRGAVAGNTPFGGPCAEVLAASEKAREQWRLEADFAAFERKIVPQKF
jgi:adenosine deaminase